MGADLPAGVTPGLRGLDRRGQQRHVFAARYLEPFESIGHPARRVGPITQTMARRAQCAAYANWLQIILNDLAGKPLLADLPFPVPGLEVVPPPRAQPQ